MGGTSDQEIRALLLSLGFSETGSDYSTSGVEFTMRGICLYQVAPASWAAYNVDEDVPLDVRRGPEFLDLLEAVMGVITGGGGNDAPHR